MDCISIGNSKKKSNLVNWLMEGSNIFEFRVYCIIDSSRQWTIRYFSVLVIPTSFFLVSVK